MTKKIRQTIPCFLCGATREIKTSKKNKPYFICEPCGLQVFIRRDAGIKLLRKFLTARAENTEGNTDDKSPLGILDELLEKP